MTRENKLALVVGFGLILFVGILISDHFSTVRSMGAANLAGPSGAVDPLALKQPDPGYIDLKGIEAPPPPDASAGALGNSPAPAVDASAADQSASRELALNTDVMPAPNAESKTTVKPDEKTPDGFVPVHTEETPVPVNVRHHEIHAGDSLYAICKQYYGDATLLPAFAKFNSISDPTNLKVGAKLLIPPAETIGGKVALNSTAKTESAPVVPSVDPNVQVKVEQKTTIKLPTKGLKSAPASPTPRTTYVVRAGDSLRQIALRVYGSKENWKKLRDLNKDVIDDPDNLRVGTVLKL